MSILLVAACCAPAAWGDAPEGPLTPAQDVARAMTWLQSPLAARRERGAHRLQALMTSTARDQILAAFAKSSGAVQLELVPVLAVDGEADATGALIQHLLILPAGEEGRVLLAMARAPNLVAYVHPLLAEDPALEALATQVMSGGLSKAESGAMSKAESDAMSKAESGAMSKAESGGLSKAESGGPKAKLSKTQAKRLDALVRLVRRAEIERMLASKKSKSGGTGYYKGQYDEIRTYGHRDLALAICVGIALDEAMPVPGVFTAGVYEFVHAHDVDLYELRGMAVNALSELASPDDHQVLGRIAGKLDELWTSIQRRRMALLAEYADNSYVSRTKKFQDEQTELGALVSDMSDYLLCLYLVHPDQYTSLLDELLRDLRRNWPYAIRPLNLDSMIPNILIRAGRFDQAVTSYLTELRTAWSSKAFIFYNMACAYACWSREPGDESAEDLKRRALRSLRRSFENGWRDVGWMEEDRDLDPIRDTAKYRALVAAINEDLDLK